VISKYKDERVTFKKLMRELITVPLRYSMANPVVKSRECSTLWEII
jgi:hypothetical protein